MIHLRSYALTTLSVILISFGMWIPASWSETLEDAWRIALANDHRIRASRMNVESERQGLLAAKSARYPSLTLESGYTVLDNAPAAVFDQPMAAIDRIPTAEDKSLSYKTTVTLPIFTGGRISKGIEAARSTLNVAAHEETKTMLDIKLEVAEAYVAVLRAKRFVDVSETTVSSLTAHTRDVSNLYEQGMVTKNDLLAAQVSLADARQQLTKTRNALSVAIAAYNRLLGRPLAQQAEIEDLTMEPRETTCDDLTSRALEKRPELASLLEQSRVLENRASTVRASTMPHLAISGGYSYAQNKYQVYEDIWSATVSVRWELFDGGTSRHQTSALLQKADSLKELRQDTASLISLQVHQACLDVDESLKRIDVTREAVAQSEENLAVTKNRYREGVGTNTEVLDAEALRAKSTSNFHNAVYDAVLAQIRLKYVTGDL